MKSEHQSKKPNTWLKNKAQSQNKSRGNNPCLFIGQLGNDVTEENIVDLLSFYGTVLSVTIYQAKEKPTGTEQTKQQMEEEHPDETANNSEQADKTICTKGTTAFVVMSTIDEADNAISSLHNKYIHGNRNKPLQVAYSKTTPVASKYGYDHSLSLHRENTTNPLIHMGVSLTKDDKH